MVEKAAHIAEAGRSHRYVASVALCVLMTGALAIFTTAAQASPPVVATDGVQVLSATAARVSGNADPEGQSTTLHADYAQADQTWCNSGGKEGTPTETVPVPIGSLNAMISELTIDLDGLAPGTEYCVELVAQNESGAALGGLATFTTIAQASPPLVVTDGAHATGGTTAIVEGTGNPEGQSTTLHADYALTSEQWCSSGGTEGTPRETAGQDLGSGHVMVSEIMVGLDGLAPASEYCVALVATNPTGTTYGSQVRFTTAAQASPPVVATDGVQVLSATAARVSGNADPEGQSTTLHADYAQADQTWCNSGGKEGTPTETVPVPIGSLNAMISELTIDLDGLAPGTEYCVELVAQNESGAALGGLATFTTIAQASPPLVVTDGVESPRPAISPIMPSATAALSGVSQPLTRAQKLKHALKACSRKAKKRRAACARNARRRYRTSMRAAGQASKGQR